MSDYLSEVRKQFEKDLFATETTGITIVDVGDNSAKCMLQLSDKHRNAMGAVMGGAIYTLADFAFAVAANHEVLNTVSISADIKFINATNGSVLYAEAQCVKMGKTSSFYDVIIYDDCDSLISKVSIVGVKVNIQK